MSQISTDIIKNAVYELCYKANTCLDESIYSKIFTAYENAKNINTKNLLKTILQNAKIAYEKKLPLCQDTGQVIVFLEIGQNVQIIGSNIEEAINIAVSECYKNNYFRKSVVQNAIFERKNTTTNTPVIIHTKIIQGNTINIKILIKGAGSENKSKLEMLLPTTEKDEFVKIAGDLILSTAENACPPMFVGIGSGLSSDGAMLLSKTSLINNCFSREETELAEEIKNYVNEKAPEKYKGCYVLDVKLSTAQTHIACMPLGISINCHSDRFSSCTIYENKTIYHHKVPSFINFEDENLPKKEIHADNIDEIKSLKEGEQILLTGNIYVARDMAHKRLVKLINDNEALPFNLKNKIIFYAGPCPAKQNEIIGSIGPTTASRMDKYAAVLYRNGIIASMGKGSRNDELKKIIKETGSKYFSVQGGIAALLAQKVTECSVIAFEDLGTEALFKIYIEKFPVKVEIA